MRLPCNGTSSPAEDADEPEQPAARTDASSNPKSAIVRMATPLSVRMAVGRRRHGGLSVSPLAIVPVASVTAGAVS